MNTLRIIITILFFISFLACETNKPKQETSSDSPTEKRSESVLPESTKTEDDNSPESFSSFYSRFLKDYAFQKSRITFPVEGDIIEEGKSIDDLIEEKDWEMLKGSVYEVDTSEYKVEIEENTEDVFHRVYIPDSGVDILMKYKRIDNKWFLIYYRSMFM